MVDRNELIAGTLPDYRSWLYRVAYDFLPAGSPDVDDLCQEGFIAMWKAVGTYDPDKGALPTWLTGAARLRMREIAHSHGQWTGHEAMRGRREVQATSLDAAVDAGWEDAGEDLLDGIELAYHHGEIAEALDSLPTEQRQYVYARFWLGIDPTSRAPGTRVLVDLFPVLRKRHLWVGAQAHLRERLAHLAA